MKAYGKAALTELGIHSAEAEGWEWMVEVWGPLAGEEERFEVILHCASLRSQVPLQDQEARGVCWDTDSKGFGDALGAVMEVEVACRNRRAP